MTRKPNQILLVLTLGVMWAGCRPDVVEQPEPAEPFALEDELPEPTPEEPPVVQEPPVQEEVLPVDCAQPAPQPERHPPGTFSWAKPGYTVVIHSAAESRYLDACQKQKLENRLFKFEERLEGNLTEEDVVRYHQLFVVNDDNSSSEFWRVEKRLQESEVNSWIGFYVSEKLLPAKELHLLEGFDKKSNEPSYLYALDNDLFASAWSGPRMQGVLWNLFVPAHTPQDRFFYDMIERAESGDEPALACYENKRETYDPTRCNYEERWDGIILMQEESRGREALQIEVRLPVGYEAVQPVAGRQRTAQVPDGQGGRKTVEAPYVMLNAKLNIVR